MGFLKLAMGFLKLAMGRELLGRGSKPAAKMLTRRGVNLADCLLEDYSLGASSSGYEVQRSSWSTDLICRSGGYMQTNVGHAQDDVFQGEVPA